MSANITATCSCGQVTFSANRNPVLQLVCHCQACQKFTGADCSSVCFFKHDSVQISGKLLQFKSTADSGNTVTRSACAHCGSSMFDQTSGHPGLFGVFGGVLNIPFEVQPRCHIFVSHKKAHVQIPAGMPQYPGAMI